MQSIIAEDDTMLLSVERVNSELWLELRQKQTGLVQILYYRRGHGHTVQNIKESYKDTPLEKIKATFDKLKLPSVKMYKPEL